MINIKVKTWCCRDCDYKQDFEPTKESMNKHFNKDIRFKVDDIKENECPCCSLKGDRGVQMVKETDNKNKTEMTFMDSQKDIDDKRTELEAIPPNTIGVGKEIRLETDEEKTERIDDAVKEYSGTEKTALKKELIALPNESREFLTYRDETSMEKKVRIDEEMSGLSFKTPEEVQELRDKYEDK